MKKTKLLLITSIVAVLCSAATAGTSYSTGFESPDFVVGTMSPTGGPTQGGWSGGSQPGFTNNTSEPGSVYDDFITTDQAHTGSQSWHFLRGYDSPGPGTPFTPELSVTAGQPSSGADVNQFIATFWFKAADPAGDDSRIMVAGGPPTGDDRSSNYLEIENVAGSGVTIRTYNGVVGSGWDATELLVATGLSATDWHKVEMAALFVNGPSNDTWTYRVNDGPAVVGGAYFETARDNGGFDYVVTNRLKFQPRHLDGNADPNVAPYLLRRHQLRGDSRAIVANPAGPGLPRPAAVGRTPANTSVTFTGGKPLI